MAENKKNIHKGPGGGGPASRMMQFKEKPKNVKKSLGRLLSYISSSKMLFISMIVVVIIYTLINLSTNIVIKEVVASLGTFNVDTGLWTLEPNKEKFTLFIILLIGLYILYCIFQYLSSLIGVHISCRTVRKLRNDLFGKIVKLPISYLDKHPHGDIMSRMTNDVDNISMAISQSITSLISGVLTLIGCIAIMVWYSPLLTLVAMLTLVFTLIVTMLLSKLMRPLFTKQQAILGELNTETEEMVTGYRTVIAYNRQEKTIKDFNKASDDFTKTGIKAQIIGGSMGPVMNFVGNLGYFVVSIFGALFIYWSYSSGRNIGGTLLGAALTIDIVIMFLTTTKQFTRPINEIAQLYSSILTALAGAERVFEILDQETENFDGEIDFEYDDIKGKLDFSHVEFGYVPEKKVLNDFDICVYSGHKIALVGATGSGKTTIVNLLLRFYDIDGGIISVDDKDISKVSKKKLRDAIAIVLQDPVLFNDTIENNIRYAKLDATDEEIDKALEMANCTGFVSRLPEGKKTVLTEGATNISQGERQLLTIARAILADPKIMILDEATSSVDTRTEKHIQDAMVNLMHGRTSIIIAHRLSTIEDADLILVLDHGVIVEQGNHQELIEQNGVYNKLYQTQFKGLEI